MRVRKKQGNGEIDRYLRLIIIELNYAGDMARV